LPQELAADLVGLAQSLADWLENMPSIDTSEDIYAKDEKAERKCKIFPDCDRHLIKEAIDLLETRALGVIQAP
jgi:hypothetical protein